MISKISPGMPSSPQTDAVIMLTAMVNPEGERTVLKMNSPTPPNKELMQSHKTFFIGFEKIFRTIIAIMAARM